MDFNSSLMIIPDSVGMFARYRSETWSFVILIFVLVLTAFTVGLYIEVVVFLHRKFEFGTRRGCIIFLSGLYPVHSLTSLVGACLPTASFTSNFIADMYLAGALYMMLRLMTDLFGGLDSTVRALSERKVPLHQPPACCFCVCLPSITINKRNYHRIRVGVVQYMFVLQVVSLLPALLWVDELVRTSQTPSAYDKITVPATVFNVLSTMFAVYCLMLLFRPSRDLLGPFYIRSLFLSMQLVLLLVNVQRVLLTILIRAGTIVCIEPLTCITELVLRTLLNILILFEMPLLGLMNRAIIGAWVRSGTHTQQFDADAKADVEIETKYELEIRDNPNDGAVENRAFSQITPDAV